MWFPWHDIPQNIWNTFTIADVISQKVWTNSCPPPPECIATKSYAVVYDLSVPEATNRQYIFLSFYPFTLPSGCFFNSRASSVIVSYPKSFFLCLCTLVVYSALYISHHLVPPPFMCYLHSLYSQEILFWTMHNTCPYYYVLISSSSEICSQLKVAKNVPVSFSVFVDLFVCL